MGMRPKKYAKIYYPWTYYLNNHTPTRMIKGYETNQELRLYFYD